ncbi:MAG: transposase [Planctomycetota bacterium]
MSTRHNYNTPGHAHELTFTCYRRIPFLSKDRSRQWLADAVNDACTKHHYRLWAYVFMPEHVHLVVWPEQTDYDIASFRRDIKSPVARHGITYLEQNAPELLTTITKQRGGRKERLFWQQGGGYDRNIDNTKTLISVIAYIHFNPVRRGLVVKPEDWEWSSARWYRDQLEGPCVVHPLNSEMG